MTLKRVQRVINGGWGGEDDNADKNKVEDKKLEQFSDYLIVLVSLKRRNYHCVRPSWKCSNEF